MRKLAPVFGTYALIGVFNTILDIVLFMLLQIFLPIILSTIISSMVAMTGSFLLNSRYTFSRSQYSARDAILFIATTGTVMWGIQPFVIYGANDLLQQEFSSDTFAVFGAKVLATGVSLVLNFLLYRYLVFPVQIKEKENVHD